MNRKGAILAAALLLGAASVCIVTFPRRGPSPVPQTASLQNLDRPLSIEEEEITADNAVLEGETEISAAESPLSDLVAELVTVLKDKGVDPRSGADLRFLNLAPGEHARYHELLRRMKEGEASRHLIIELVDCAESFIERYVRDNSDRTLSYWIAAGLEEDLSELNQNSADAETVEIAMARARYWKLLSVRCNRPYVPGIGEGLRDAMEAQYERVHDMQLVHPANDFQRQYLLHLYRTQKPPTMGVGLFKGERPVHALSYLPADLDGFPLKVLKFIPQDHLQVPSLARDYITVKKYYCWARLAQADKLCSSDVPGDVPELGTWYYRTVLDHSRDIVDKLGDRLNPVDQQWFSELIQRAEQALQGPD